MSKPVDLEALLSGVSEAETLTFYNGTVTLKYNDKLHAYYVEEADGTYLVGGATTVLGVIDKPALLQWAANSAVAHISSKIDPSADVVGFTPAVWNEILGEAKVAYRKISSDATDTGKIAHDWLERRNLAIIAGIPWEKSNDEPLPTEAAAANCVMAALAWQEKHKFNPVAAEQKVYSRELGVAGTFDWTAVISSCDDPTCCPGSFKDILALGDYKSSKAIYDEYKLQTAFYKFALEEEHGTDIKARVILQLGKDTGEFSSHLTFDDDEYQLDLAGFQGALAIYNWQTQRRLDKRFEKEQAKAAKALMNLVKKPRKPRIKEKSEDEGMIPLG